MRKVLPLIFLLMLSAFCASAAEATPTSVAGHLRTAIDSDPDFSDLQTTARRSGYVILQAWRTEELARIKAANPATKVLVYKNLSASIESSNGGRFSTGVSYQEADAEHPEWFLRDPTGQRLRFDDYSYLHAMDVGSASYQRRWADNVIAELRDEGWDGVFLDDVNTTMQYHLDPASIARYPTDAAWQQATSSALAYIGPQVQGAGKLAIANIGSWAGDPEVGREWLAHLSGAMDEMFTKWGSAPGEGYAWEGTWQDQLDSLEYAQAHGKEFLAITHSANDDAEAARYGWATVLLGADGRADYALHQNYSTESWIPEYDYPIGEPLGPESRDPDGVHRRLFRSGIVLVNPTDDPQHVNLGGTYSGSGWNEVTSLELDPHSAAVMTGYVRGPGPGSIDLGRKRVRRGSVVVRGALRIAAREPTGSQVRVVLSRHGRSYRQRAATPRRNGKFIGRVRVCHAGRYRISAIDTATGTRARWPRPIRVRASQLRC